MRQLYLESWSHQNQDDRNYDGQSVRQTIWQISVLGTEAGELKMGGKNYGKNI